MGMENRVAGKGRKREGTVEGGAVNREGGGGRREQRG